MAPAIRFAELGFTLDQGDVDMLQAATDDFKRDTPSAAVFLHKDKKPYAVGEKLIQKDLARTLGKLQETLS